MLHTTWNRIRHGRGHVVLTVLAVAVGVAFLTAALVLSGSTRAALDDSYAQAYAGTDVIVRGELGHADLRQVLDVPGVGHAEERVQRTAHLIAATGEGQAGVATVVPADPDRTAIEVRSGRLPVGAGEVAVDAAAAARLDLQPGDRVDVLLPAGPQRVEVVGTVGFGRLDGLAGGARVLFAAPVAEHLRGTSGTAELAVVGQPGTSAERLAERVAAVVGEHAVVLTAAEAATRDAAAAADRTAVLSWVVVAVAVVALVVGGVLVANAFRMLVAERGRELALLRAVGATRRQVAATIRLEAAMTGALGSLVGVPLGGLAGALAVSTSSGLLPGLPPTSPTLSPRALLVGPAIGIGLAVISARGAARTAVAVPPVAALRSVAIADRRPSPVRGGVGAALVAAGSAAAVGGARAGATVVLVPGVVALLVGTGIAFPLVTGPILQVVSSPLRHMGITGALARQQALSAPRRTGATAAALAVTLAVTAFLLVVGATLSAATPDLLAARQRAEITIRSSAPQGLHDALLDIAGRADRLPGVDTARVVTYAELGVTDPARDGRRHTAATYVVDPAAVGRLFDVESRAGRLDRLAVGQVAVRDTVAAAQGWEIGDRLTVRFPDGTSDELEVSALFAGDITTDWIVGPGTAGAHLEDASREAFVRLEDRAAVAAVRPALEELVRDVPTVSVVSRDEQAAQMAEENQGSLGILTGLFALSLVVGLLGVVNTLSLAVRSRVREIGLLRAVGATRGQIRAVIRWEAAVTSVLGAGLGTALGVGAAWIAVSSLQGQPLAVTVPVPHVTAAVVATALLGVAASVVPSARAARIEVLAAVHHP